MTTRAVKVEALKLCSAYRISEVSNAETICRLGYLAERHVQEVRGEAEVVAGREGAEAVAPPLVERDDRRQHGEQPQGLGLVGGG